jgi:hypothetical protein
MQLFLFSFVVTYFLLFPFLRFLFSEKRKKKKVRHHKWKTTIAVVQCKWSKNKYTKYIYGTSIAYSVIIFTAGKKWLKKNDSGMTKSRKKWLRQNLTKSRRAKMQRWENWVKPLKTQNSKIKYVICNRKNQKSKLKNQKSKIKKSKN